MFINKEDYEEACCLLKKPDGKTPIPVGRVIEKLDEYLSVNDYDSAENHLDYWLKEAEASNDLRGKLTVLNEQIGIYRKRGKREEGFIAADCALKLAKQLDLTNTLAYATTLLNVATLYEAFKLAEKAIPLYESAREIYESSLSPTDERLGGLYNNMALALVDLKRYDEAEELYRKALIVMEAQPHGEGEMAITYLNLADLASAKYGLLDGEKIIDDYLDKAEKLLDMDIPEDGNYAFVCEKCAPVFDYYGRFMTARKLSGRAKKIYERS